MDDTQSNRINHEEFIRNLDNIQCQNCNYMGMISIGGYDWQCPNCSYKGSISD